MRIPLTKYGLPQVAVVPAIIMSAMVIFAILTAGKLTAGPIITIETMLTLVLVWALSFFRDPHRQIPTDDNLLLAPADGKVTDIEIVEGNLCDCEKALRVGIFLSVFNVHINRAPCDGQVEKITYKKGKYKNAMNPVSSKINESNDIAFVKTDGSGDKLVVRQISGAIARRIVCKAKAGDELKTGEKFGMIKFGSRTELYLPMRENTKCVIKIGDKLKAGQSVIIRYE